MSSPPSTPPPVVINHPLFFALGTGAWFLALLLMVALDLMGVYRARVWIAVCAVGMALGVIAIIYTKFSWRTRRSEAAGSRFRAAPATAAATRPPGTPSSPAKAGAKPLISGGAETTAEPSGRPPGTAG